MGDIIIAVCPCGLTSKQIFRGIGFIYFETGHFCEPAYCDTCGIVEGKEASRSYSKCPSCRRKMKFYNPQLNEQEEEVSGEPAFSHYLEGETQWHCPKCKQETLKFENIGCWD